MQFELPFSLGERRAVAGEWLVVGGRRVPLRLARNRRARRYVLRLAPDGAARLTIPRGGSAGEARRFAERNLAWLEKQLLRQAARPVSPTTWSAGTEILFRGERVRLEVWGIADRGLRIADCRGTGTKRAEAASCTHELGAQLCPPGSSPASLLIRNPQSAIRNPEGLLTSAPTGGKWRVRFGTEELVVREAARDLRPVVEGYLRRLAERELPARVFELAGVHQLVVQRVSVRNQRSRWGSFSRRGTISLNWRLVQTPLFVRDYIILHELAHLKEMNHSPRFWREVARLCPEFEQAERWLKTQDQLLR